jgi:hypothetical protein
LLNVAGTDARGHIFADTVEVTEVLLIYLLRCPYRLLPLGRIEISISPKLRNHPASRFDLSSEDGAAIDRPTECVVSERWPDAEN